MKNVESWRCNEPVYHIGVIQDMNDYTYVATFYYGHGINKSISAWLTIDDTEWYEVPIEHYQYWPTDYEYNYPDPPINEFWDTLAYGGTTQGTHYFVFMWHCASGKEIGYFDPYFIDYGNGWHYHGTGPVGMAFSFTQQDNATLSEDGYGNPDETDYCFIGFETFSPPLSNVTGYNGKTLADFVTKFYNSSVVSHCSINQALDYAAWEAFGVDYEDSVFYTGWDAYVPPPENETWATSMKVYGNGNNYIATGD